MIDTQCHAPNSTRELHAIHLVVFDQRLDSHTETNIVRYDTGSLQLSTRGTLGTSPSSFHRLTPLRCCPMPHRQFVSILIGPARLLHNAECVPVCPTPFTPCPLFSSTSSTSCTSYIYIYIYIYIYRSTCLRLRSITYQ